MGKSRKAEKSAAKNKGIKVAAPSKSCDDINCPFHGNISLRGKRFTGVVTSDKMHKTVTVMWVGHHYLPKYERHEKRMTKIHCHNPSCIDAKKGDRVEVMETKPLSKTKNFVVVERLGKDIDYEIKDQTIVADEEGKKEAADEKIAKKAKSKEETKATKENVPANIESDAQMDNTKAGIDADKEGE